MNQNQFVKIALIAPLIIFGVTPAFAAVPIPNPVCHIEGTIQSVEFENAYNDPCLSVLSPLPCATDMELVHPARYFLGVSINSASFVSNRAFTPATCGSLYLIGSVQPIRINKDEVKPGDAFAVGQKIEGIVYSDRGNTGGSLDSYSLEDGTDVNKPITKEKFDFLPLIMAAGIIFVGLVVAGIIDKIVSSRKKISS